MLQIALLSIKLSKQQNGGRNSPAQGNQKRAWLVPTLVIQVSQGMKRRLLSGVLALLVLSGWASAAPVPARPASWAAAVAGTHVPNLYRIEPDLLRSAQPDTAGFQDLATLGVKTVLDLRAGHADAEQAGK